MTTILGIDTSCDDTAVALYSDTEGDLLNLISSQEELHTRYGGVVPEIAAREHLKSIPHLMRVLTEEFGNYTELIDAIAVTFGPGLVGSLLTGLSFGKSLSYRLNLPFISINHLEGHIYSCLVNKEFPETPGLVMVVSGGHTLMARVVEEGDYEVLGQTRDDACGEAFDKVAKALNLGYPGGPEIEEFARNSSSPIDFPIPMERSESLDFSFSGLKTAVINYIKELNKDTLSTEEISDISSGFQNSVVESLIIKIKRELDRNDYNFLLVSGGVIANEFLRDKVDELTSYGIDIILPPVEYSTDNAMMIARCGLFHYHKEDFSKLDMEAYPTINLGEEPSKEMFRR